jgi:hypothetical protein
LASRALLFLGVFVLPALVAVAASARIAPSRLRQLAWPLAIWLLLRVGATIGGLRPRSMPDWLFGLATWVAPLAGAALAALWTDVLRNPRARSPAVAQSFYSHRSSWRR